MESRSSPVCVLNSVTNIPINYEFQNQQVFQSTDEVLFLVSLVQDNGTSELVQLTEEQANALGICLFNSIETGSPETPENIIIDNIPSNSDTNNVCIETTLPITKPLGSSENPIEIIKDGEVLHTTQNISADYLQQIANALSVDSDPKDVAEVDDSKNVIYRVMFPDELHLTPSATKRGRPKKRLKNAKKTENVINKEEAKPVKNVRTRSGRITRPPKYIKQDFRKIETMEVDDSSDLKLVEFESLKTNETVRTELTTSITIEEPSNGKRKRPISSQYRCPTCQKAYLGYIRMLEHIQKHPDHGPLREHSLLEENDTWNYLIDISNTTPVGQRGSKFFKQLVTLLQNVQIVAKLLFRRSSGTEKNIYFIDSLLSKVLGIEPGNYTINENRLQRDVGLMQFISESLSNRSSVVNNEQTPKFNLHTYLTKNHLDSQQEDEVKPLIQNVSKSFSKIHSTNQTIEVVNCKLENVDFNEEFKRHNFSSEQTKLVDTNEQPIPNNEFSLQSELLSDNSLLNSLPTLRTSVEELILNNVDSTQVTNLLDNSTSSDDIMNVDQFVNERFKNFTELTTPSLSLDLPTLDLFQFHSS